MLVATFLDFTQKGCATILVLKSDF